MSQETLNIVLVVIGAVLVGLVWALDRMNKRVADSVPPSVMGILQVAVTALQTLAEKSPSKLDDEIVGLLKLLVQSNPPTPPATPPQPPTASVTYISTPPPTSGGTITSAGIPTIITNG